MASLHLQRNSDSVTVKIQDDSSIQLRTVDHYRLVLEGVELDSIEDDVEEGRR